MRNLITNFNLMIILLCLVWVIPGVMFVISSTSEKAQPDVQLEHRIVLIQTAFVETYTLPDVKLAEVLPQCSQPNFIVTGARDGRYGNRINVKVIASEMKPQYPVAAINCAITELSKELKKVLVIDVVEGFRRSCTLFAEFLDFVGAGEAPLRCQHDLVKQEAIIDNIGSHDYEDVRLYDIFDTSPVLSPSINQLKPFVSSLERSISFAALLTILILLGHVLARHALDKR